MSIFSTQEPAVWFPAIKAGSGADTFTEQLAIGLQKQGIRAEITWLPHHAEYLPWLIKKPVKPDWANIVHVNSWLPARFLGHGLPIVANVHLCVQDPALSPYKSFPQKLYHQLWVTPVERTVIQHANRVIAVSKYTAQKVTSFFNAPNVSFIHNGVDTHIFRPIEEKPPGAVFRLLYAGNHSSRKGFNLLPEIMRQLGPAYELVYTAGRDHVSTHLPNNMHALPRLSWPLEMAKVYQQVDALLFPSQLEGFGLVAAEAMACGVPVIASNNSSLPEIIEHEVNGLLCPSQDINAFVDAIRKLANNRQMYLDMTQAARQHIQQEFYVDKMVEQYIRTYREVLSTSD